MCVCVYIYYIIKIYTIHTGSWMRLLLKRSGFWLRGREGGGTGEEEIVLVGGEEEIVLLGGEEEIVLLGGEVAC